MRVSNARPNPNPQPRVVYRPGRYRPQDCLIAPAIDLPPTPPSATKVELSSTASFPSAPYRRPNRPVSPFLHGVSATSAFPPFVHLNSRHPFTPPRQSPAVIHIVAQFIRVTCPCPRCCRGARSEPMPLLPRKKKAGEPLKSSLKAKRTPARGSLTVITNPAA